MTIFGCQMVYFCANINNFSTNFPEGGPQTTLNSSCDYILILRCSIQENYNSYKDSREKRKLKYM